MCAIRCIRSVRLNLGNLLRVLVHSHPRQNLVDTNALVDEALLIASCALRTTVHKMLGVSPGSAVFNRDRILDISFIADLILL